MDDLPLAALFGLLFLLLACSAFFSGSETGLMTMNRYRLKTRMQKGERGARLAWRLLKKPDRLIGTILLGNNFINSLAAAVATVISLRLIPGDSGIAIATGAVTLLLLIFGEVTPKTLAALHPERIAIPAAYALWPLRKLLSPLVWTVGLISNGLLRLLGVSQEDAAQHSLSAEELRTVVAEAGAMIPQRHQKMLLSILDLEKATVEDIMIPRNEVIGLDISEPWDTVVRSVVESEHTRLPVFDGSIDRLKGVVHVRRLLPLIAADHFTRDNLLALCREPYFIPESTPLNHQLVNFQNQQRRIGFVVDEYGDIQGLVTLEDILEEVIGEFTSDPATQLKNVFAEADGAYRVKGSAPIRTLNRTLGWKLPTDGPKTINGLLLEQLEALPQPGARTDIDGYRFEITEARASGVKMVRVWPPRTTPVPRTAKD